MTSRASGTAAVGRLGAATLGSALLGWAALLLAARVLGPEDYAAFAVSWGMIFGIGGLCAGLQQEVTRSVSTADDSRGTPNALLAAGSVGGFGALLLVLTAPAWGPRVLGHQWVSGALAIAAGFLSIAIMTALNGLLTTTDDWGMISAQVWGDASIRLVAVASVVAAGGGPPALAWAIVSGTFVWAGALAAPSARRSARRPLGQALSSFLPRAGSAMIGAGLAALLVTGFPLLVRVMEPGSLGPEAGVLFAAVVATRAPLLLPLYGLRPLLLKHLLAKRTKLMSAVGVLLALGLALGGVGALLAFWIGPELLELMLGTAFSASASLLAVLTFSGALIGLLTVTSMALIVDDRHLASTLGWFAAVLSTCLALLVPLTLESSAMLALLVGPVIGLAFHLGVLVTSSRGRYSNPSENAASRSRVE